MTDGAPILVYHQVLPSPDVRGSGVVHAGTFERQMRFLADGGYSTWTIAELLALAERGRATPRRSVALTFDDATVDHWSYVFPVLERYHLKATFFVPTGHIEDGPRRRSLADVRAGAGADVSPPATHGHMRWSELEAVARSGLVDLESHGHLHLRPRPREDGPPDAAELKRIAEDLKTSRELLRHRLRRESRILAWPHGIASPEMQRCAFAEGFRVALGTQTQVPGASEALLRRRHFGEDYEGPLREAVHYLRFVQTIESTCRVGWRWRLVHGVGVLSRAARRCRVGGGV